MKKLITDVPSGSILQPKGRGEESETLSLPFRFLFQPLVNRLVKFLTSLAFDCDRDKPN